MSSLIIPQRHLSLVPSRLALYRARADNREQPVTRVTHTVSEEVAWHPLPIPVFARSPVRSTLHSYELHPHAPRDHARQPMRRARALEGTLGSRPFW